MPKIRIIFILNTNRQVQKIGICEPVWKDVLKMARNKLNKKIKRIFLESGQEVSLEMVDKLFDDVKLLCSTGEDFTGKVTGKNILEKSTIDCQILAIESHIDPVAIQQLDHTCTLPGLVKIRGLPDLHPGNGIPVGATCLFKDRVYPYLVGTDIGCGMAFYQLDLETNKFNAEKLAKKIRKSDIDKGYDGDISQFTEQDIDYREQLGTVGAGNHFAEFMAISEVYSSQIDQNHVYLLVHSGSRRFGKEIHDQFGQYLTGLSPDSPECQDYMKLHDKANQYAHLNRDIIAHRLAQIANSSYHNLFHLSHNFVEHIVLDGEEFWLHRKGVASVKPEQNLLVIPGSRGDYSYLVEPIHEKMPDCLWSIAHGAGRRLSRHAVPRHIPASQYTRTELGNPVICDNKDLLYEEAPQAYKNVEVVIDDLVKLGFIKVVAKMKPLLTFKTLS